MIRRLTAAAVVIFASLAPASAERLVVSVSNHRVGITSNFTGEDLVLFGTVEPDPGKPLAQGAYDLVVTIRGPHETLRARRKDRVLGIWVNVDSREFVRVPSYLAVLSNRALTEITNAETRRRLQIGLDNYQLPQRIGPDLADTVNEDPFRAAFVRIEEQRRLYLEQPTGVTFLTRSVFRAAIPLPANVPTGTYAIDVKLFANGALVTSTTTALEVIKAGFEQYVADAARDHGFLYGLITASMALMIGWIGSIVFRRD